MDELAELREQNKQLAEENANLKMALLEQRVRTLETSLKNQNLTIKAVQVVANEVATKFNFLMSLSIGEGALSAIVLFKSLLRV